jgi:hypothetical protein
MTCNGPAGLVSWCEPTLSGSEGSRDAAFFITNLSRLTGGAGSQLIKPSELYAGLILKLSGCKGIMSLSPQFCFAWRAEQKTASRKLWNYYCIR